MSSHKERRLFTCTNKRHARSALLAIAAVACLSSTTTAAIIDYGTLNGSDVTYANVKEDTRSAPTALFGAASVTSNFLDFDPLSFASNTSSSTGTSGSDIVGGQLNFIVMSNSNTFDITNVVITEGGDYTTTGLGAAQATATVAAPVSYTITHVAGAPLLSPVAGSGNVVFTPGGAFDITNGPGGLWDGVLNVDIRSALDAAGISGAATTIEFIIDNTLTTSGSDGGSAFIAKKDFNVSTVGEIVPEPGSFSLLLGFGFLMFPGRARRK